jgi:hypothetical protein
VVAAVAAAVAALPSGVQLDQAAVERIAAAVTARPDVPLGDADRPAIVAAVTEAIRSLVAD